MFESKYVLIWGLVVSCVLLPAPMIVAAVMEKRHIDGRSALARGMGIVFAIATVYCCLALGYGLRDGNDMGLASFVFQRYLFFGGALVCLMIGVVSVALATGKADRIKSATGLDWPGYLAGLLAAQVIVFFQQCNMQGVFQSA